MEARFPVEGICEGKKGSLPKADTNVSPHIRSFFPCIFFIIKKQYSHYHDQWENNGRYQQDGLLNIHCLY